MTKITSLVADEIKRARFCRGLIIVAVTYTVCYYSRARRSKRRKVRHQTTIVKQDTVRINNISLIDRRGVARLRTIHQDTFYP